jgi:putative SOS response-associated peptidase YedK
VSFLTQDDLRGGKIWQCMPVLLAEKDYEPWLSGKAGLELLKPAAENLLQRWQVSKRVNSSRAPNDDPTLIDKVAI